METVKKDLLKLAGGGSKTIKFVDRTFNANERHANEIFEFIGDQVLSFFVVKIVSERFGLDKCPTK